MSKTRRACSEATRRGPCPGSSLSEKEGDRVRTALRGTVGHVSPTGLQSPAKSPLCTVGINQVLSLLEVGCRAVGGGVQGREGNLTHTSQSRGTIGTGVGSPETSLQ